MLSPALLWDAAQSCVPRTQLPLEPQNGSDGEGPLGPSSPAVKITLPRATSPAARLGQLCQGSTCPLAAGSASCARGPWREVGARPRHTACQTVSLCPRTVRWPWAASLCRCRGRGPCRVTGLGVLWLQPAGSPGKGRRARVWLPRLGLGVARGLPALPAPRHAVAPLARPWPAPARRGWQRPPARPRSAPVRGGGSHAWGAQGWRGGRCGGRSAVPGAESAVQRPGLCRPPAPAAG